jgi:hypothetical protein
MPNWHLKQPVTGGDRLKLEVAICDLKMLLSFKVTLFDLEGGHKP